MYSSEGNFLFLDVSFRFRLSLDCRRSHLDGYLVGAWNHDNTYCQAQIFANACLQTVIRILLRILIDNFHDSVIIDQL